MNASSIAHFHAPATGPSYRTRHNPRRDLLDEVLAGYLWMSLDLPRDMTMAEMKIMAHQLVTHIQSGAGEAAIEARLEYIQRHQLGRAANMPSIRRLAKQSVTMAICAQAR